MFNILLEKLRNNKGSLFIFGGVLLFIIAFFVDLRQVNNSQDSLQNPVISSPDDRSVVLPRTIEIASVIPENGNVTTLDSYQSIVFTFNKEIEIETLSYTVVPGINLSVLPVANNAVEFIPGRGSNGWESYVEYTITINNIVSLDGTSKFKGPYRYTYKNVPPDTRKITLPF